MRITSDLLPFIGMTQRQLIASARASADAIIDQQTRRANGWDKGDYRDDVRTIDRTATIEETLHQHAADGFAASAVYYTL